ncbi:MAG TPA: hypothetical protein PLC15_23825 [Candidatus Obscuribacter sp.]|nr:hypothetical protein [Candidatus Obscuribacter sp.]HNH76605.1 hypothetical protein [Candidatus Obscuribacter sp.]
MQETKYKTLASNTSNAHTAYCSLSLNKGASALVRKGGMRFVRELDLVLEEEKEMTIKNISIKSQAPYSTALAFISSHEDA